VVECTGKFKSKEALAPYLNQGVKKVVVSAPVKDGTLNIVMGANDHLYDPKVHQIVTAASCTTNCIAPIVKVIHENFGIKHGSITTIHDMTNTQSILDEYHKDLRRARASSLSLIPTSTGSATAITEIFPELKGKLNGMAVRVPLANASLTDCVFEVEQPVTVEVVNAALEAAAMGELKGILGYETKPLVSADYTNDTRSSTVDALSTMIINGTQVKILTWYDNEMGYVQRMMELTKKLAQSL
jgi:glyceraldehyde 3-phosphate dehydrogenase